MLHYIWDRNWQSDKNLHSLAFAKGDGRIKFADILNSRLLYDKCCTLLLSEIIEIVKALNKKENKIRSLAALTETL